MAFAPDEVCPLLGYSSFAFGAVWRVLDMSFSSMLIQFTLRAHPCLESYQQVCVIFFHMPALFLNISYFLNNVQNFLICIWTIVLNWNFYLFLIW